MVGITFGRTIQYRDPKSGNTLKNEVSDDVNVTFDFTEAEKKFKHTIILYDKDAPYPNAPTNAPYIHWLVSGITGVNIHSGDIIFPYLPPNPPVNSPPHTYILKVYRNSYPLEFRYTEYSRKNFPIDDFVNTNNLIEIDHVSVELGKGWATDEDTGSADIAMSSQYYEGSSTDSDATSESDSDSHTSNSIKTSSGGSLVSNVAKSSESVPSKSSLLDKSDEFGSAPIRSSSSYATAPTKQSSKVPVSASSRSVEAFASAPNISPSRSANQLPTSSSSSELLSNFGSSSRNYGYDKDTDKHGRNSCGCSKDRDYGSRGKNRSKRGRNYVSVSNTSELYDKAMDRARERVALDSNYNGRYDSSSDEEFSVPNRSLSRNYDDRNDTNNRRSSSPSRNYNDRNTSSRRSSSPSRNYNDRNTSSRRSSSPPRKPSSDNYRNISREYYGDVDRDYTTEARHGDFPRSRDYVGKDKKSITPFKKSLPEKERAYCSCVIKVGEQLKKYGKDGNAFAICAASTGTTSSRCAENYDFAKMDDDQLKSFMKSHGKKVKGAYTREKALKVVAGGME